MINFNNYKITKINFFYLLTIRFRHNINNSNSIKECHY